MVQCTDLNAVEMRGSDLVETVVFSRLGELSFFKADLISGLENLRPNLKF